MLIDIIKINVQQITEYKRGEKNPSKGTYKVTYQMRCNT